MFSERGTGRYRVVARLLPFTPSWFWEVVDTADDTFVDNSLALSRSVYESPTDALAAGRVYLLGGAMALARPAPQRRAA